LSGGRKGKGGRGGLGGDWGKSAAVGVKKQNEEGP